VGIVFRHVRYRPLVAWVAVLVAVPLACLGGALFMVWQIHGAPAATWYRLLALYLEFGAGATIGAIIGWRTSHSPRRTLAFAAAGFVCFFVWLVVYLEVYTWVTGIPITGND
jgi:hypothetical protein